MINCQNISFSNELSQRRMAQAQKHLGAKIVNRIICFALYLLGVNRNSSSDLLNIPSGSVRSIIRVILRDGPKIGGGACQHLSRLKALKNRKALSVYKMNGSLLIWVLTANLRYHLKILFRLKLSS